MGRARLWPERSTVTLSASTCQPQVPARLTRPSITPFPAGCTLWVALAWMPSPKFLLHIRAVHPFVPPLPWLCRCLWPHAMLRGRKLQWLWWSLQGNADSPPFRGYKKHPEVSLNDLLQMGKHRQQAQYLPSLPGFWNAMASHNTAKTNTAIKNLCAMSLVLQTDKWVAEWWQWQALPGNPFSPSYIRVTSIKK